MLIGFSLPKPDLKTVRLIKNALHEVLQLESGMVITLSELACLELDCAPVETVFGLLRPGQALLQHKIHKRIEDITPVELVHVCSQWGFEVHQGAFDPYFKSTHHSRITK